MLAEVKRFVAREQLFVQDEALHVGVSGGIDSMVLLHVLRTMGHACSVVHVDHDLRGAESDADAAFVVEHCRAQHVPCEVVKVNVKERMGAAGVSAQMAARELRYEAFNHVLHQAGGGKLALAHHADDAVETLLINLMRGNGIAGWGSIPPVSGPFVRPLLGVRREAIRAYAEAHGIAYREDASNTDPHYLRNRVRNEVLPLFEELRAGSAGVLAREVQHLRGLRDVAIARFQGLAGSVVEDVNGRCLLRSELLRSSGSPQLFLQWWLSARGTLHPDAVQAAVHAMDEGRVGARFDAGNCMLIVEREGVLVVTGEAMSDGIALIHADLVPSPAARLAVSRKQGPVDPTGLSPTTVWLDRRRLQFPLVVGPWQPGDRMRPLGLGGSKLISDILTDDKVPHHRRKHCRVMRSGEDIVWLLGHRVAEGYAAGPGTVEVLVATDLE